MMVSTPQSNPIFQGIVLWKGETIPKGLAYLELIPNQKEKKFQ